MKTTIAVDILGITKQPDVREKNLEPSFTVTVELKFCCGKP